MIDLFSGVGGFTLGFMDRSQEPACAFLPRLMVDNDPEARLTAIRNLPSVPFLTADLGRVDAAVLRAKAGLEPRQQLHVLVGGPPCQGFSWLGRRALDDKRNVLVVDFLRAVEALRPLVAVMENVPLIVTSHGGQIIHEVCDSLSSLGYASAADVMIASDFGVPQLRKRAVVMAYRGDLGMPPQLPKRTHERVAFASLLHNGNGRVRFEPEKLPYVSVEEAIGDLPPLKAGEGDEVMPYTSPPLTAYQEWARQGSLAIFNHRSRAHSDAYLKKIAVIEEGGRNTELPEEIRFSDNYYSQAYARLHRNGIGHTITTYFGNPGSGRFMHYRDLRSITVREAARFQSFPDAFVFDGPQQTQMRHVGNAVPPLLARAIRDQVARDLLAAGVHQPRPVGRPKKVRRQETPEERSRVMRAVHGKNSAPEVGLRKALWADGVRGYRLHSRKTPGTPDLFFPVEGLAVFVDGCFWHGCPACYRAPKTRTEYWSLKVKRNRERDAAVTAECRAGGIRVIRVWEHEVTKATANVARRVRRALARVGKRARIASQRRASL